MTKMVTQEPETILIVAANPANTTRLRLDQEVHEIQSGLRNSRKRFEIIQRWAARPRDLRQALLDHKPAYVHFCGHGEGSAGIVLEGQMVSATALAKLFSLFANSTKCVVLNACYSLVQAEAIADHIANVVGMDRAIGDSAAIEFSTAFYETLGAGESIQLAYDLGCNAIQLAGIAEHLTPKLLTRSSQGAPRSLPSPGRKPKHDWDGAPDASLIYGRGADAELLKSWILGDSCRVVLITGLGGVGKTDLVTCLSRGGNRSTDSSAILAAGIQSHFDRVIWRSALNAPAPQIFFADLLDFLSSHQRKVTSDAERQIDEILGVFQEERCLVVLDNVESLLMADDPAMQYRAGYEPYGRFFLQVAKTTHRSCLLLTSREKPSPIADLEGDRKPVRSLALGGIGTAESQNLFEQIGRFSGGASHWDQIAKLYHGNPLALELAARHIQQVFHGSLNAFLESGRPVFADLEDLLDWHLNRLSREESEVVYWLAIEREPVALATLYDDIFLPLARKNLASTLQSLQRRIPLERTGEGKFGLQPVLIEHITSRLVDAIASALSEMCIALKRWDCGEACAISIPESLDPLNQYSIVKSTAREHVRHSQERLILAPIADRIAEFWPEELSLALIRLLSVWRTQKKGEPGYAVGNLIHLLIYLKADLHGINFSHLRIWQTSLHDVNLHATDFSFAEFRHTTFRQAFGTVFSVCYSRNGEIIAVGDDNGEIRLLVAATGQLQTRCVGHADVVGTIAFSPDGNTMASGSFDNTVRLWNFKTGECTKVLLGHEGWVYCIAFSPDGTKLASASEDGTCRLWDVETGRFKHVGTHEAAFLAAVAFSLDGRHLAVAGSAGKIRLIDISNSDQGFELGERTGRIRCLVFSPQDDVLASGGEDHQIHIWQPSTGKCLARLVGHTGDVMSLSFAPGGDLLISASQDQTARLWSVAQGHCVSRLDVASARVWTAACNPEGQTVATGSEDGAVRIWDIDSCQCLATWRGYSNKTWATAFSPHDSTLLIAGNEDKLVRIWDVTEARITLELRGHMNRIWSVACSADGKWVASASDDNTVRLWDIGAGACAHVMRGHVDWIRAVIFCPDSRSVASGAEDGKLILWDVETGNSYLTIHTGIPRIFTIAYCNKGSWIATGGADNTVKIFDSTSGAVVGKLSGHLSWVNCVTPLDGSRLATCSDDGTIRIWNLGDFNCDAILNNGAETECCCGSDMGRVLFAGAANGRLCRWDLEKKTCVAEVTAHHGPLWSLTVNAAANLVATAGGDGAIRLWSVADLTPCSTPHILRPIRPYEGMNITGAFGLFPAEKEALIALGAIAMPAN